MQYRQLLALLEENADSDYRIFQKRLFKNDSVNLLGVRIPTLRKIAKQFKDDLENLFAFPDEFYEVTFIKLTAASYLDYGEFTGYVDKCVALIDNWATCDCFSPKCIAKNRDSFLPYIDKYINSENEFYQRFALTTLLHFYVEEAYLDKIFQTIKKADTGQYYVYMAAAWLVAVVLAKYYRSGVEFLQSGAIDVKTHNKAIQKANESFRLSEEQKNYLKEIKR